MSRTIGTHSSSRVVGRSVAARVAGAAARAGCRRAVRGPAEGLDASPRNPGAIGRFVDVEQVDGEADRRERVVRRAARPTVPTRRRLAGRATRKAWATGRRSSPAAGEASGSTIGVTV